MKFKYYIDGEEFTKEEFEYELRVILTNNSQIDFEKQYEKTIEIEGKKYDYLYVWGLVDPIGLKLAKKGHLIQSVNDIVKELEGQVGQEDKFVDGLYAISYIDDYRSAEISYEIKVVKE